MTNVTEAELIERSQYPRVTYEYLTSQIVDEKFHYWGLKVVCELTLKNGFTVTGESACAVPGNWKKDVGERLARKDAEGKIWPLLGYELKTKVYEATELHKTLTNPAPGYRCFVGSEAIWATEMKRGEYNTYRGWTIPDDEDPLDEGYIVSRLGGHQSWFPKEVFEAKYQEMDINGAGSVGGPTWEDRLEEEIAQNKERLEKLLSFMDNPIFKSLDAAQQQLMKQQLDLMQALHGVLTARVIG